MDSLFDIEDSFDFQFRLYSSGTFPPHFSLFILTVKDSIYSARYFKRDRVDSINFGWVEIPVYNKNLKVFWQAVYQKDVFRLPSFQEVLRKYQNISTNFKDGISYSIEYATRDKKNGASGYRCPNLLSRKYPEVKEVKLMSDIIELIYNLVGMKWKLC